MKGFRLKDMRFGLLVCAVALLAAVFGLGRDASAQADTRRGLAITPPTFELSANPGDTLTNTIRLDNISDSRLEIKTDVRNFTALGEEGQVTLETTGEKYSLVAWTQVAPQTAVLNPGESKFFSFTITVPPAGDPGGHFGSIVFSTEVPPPGGGSGATVGQEIGALVLLRVSGDARESLKIENFNAVKIVNQESGETKATKLVPEGPVPFEARIANDGNVFLKPKGVITVTDIFNRTVAEFQLDSQNVLPEAIRKMSATWESAFLLGKYDAQITLTYGVNNEQIVTATTTFWAVPYKNKAFLIGFAVFLLIVFISVRWRKRLKMAFRVLFGRN